MNKVSQLVNSSTKARSLSSAMVGFVSFGLWAYWVNSGYGQAAAWKAAMTQGSYSFIVTLLNTYIIEFIYRTLAGQRLQTMATIVVTSLLVCVLSWCVNSLSGTPEIIMTILPGCIISTVYGAAYTQLLKKIDSHPLKL